VPRVVVHRVRFELTLRSKAHARAAQDAASRFAERELPGILEAALASLAENEETLVIRELRLDLGEIPPRALSVELPARAPPALARAVAALASDASEPRSNVRRLPLAAHRMQRLIRYLRDGLFEPPADREEPATPQALFDALVAAGEPVARELARHLGTDRRAARRLALRFNEATFGRLVSDLAPGLLPEIERRYAEGDWNLSPGRIRALVLEAVLEQPSKPPATADLLQRLATALVEREPGEMRSSDPHGVAILVGAGDDSREPQIQNRAAKSAKTADSDAAEPSRPTSPMRQLERLAPNFFGFYETVLMAVEALDKSAPFAAPSDPLTAWRAATDLVAQTRGALDPRRFVSGLAARLAAERALDVKVYLMLLRERAGVDAKGRARFQPLLQILDSLDASPGAAALARHALGGKERVDDIATLPVEATSGRQEALRREALAQRLRGASRTLPTPPSPPEGQPDLRDEGEGAIATGEREAVAAFVRLLRHGAPPRRTDLAAWIDDLSRRAPEAISALAIEACADPAARQNLVKLLPPAALQRLGALIIRGDNARALAFAADLIRAGGADRPGAPAVIYDCLLREFARNAGAQRPQALVRQMLADVAVFERRPLAEILRDWRAALARLAPPNPDADELLPTSSARAEAPRAVLAGAQTHVRDAGLVLLHAYFPTLFGRLELVRDGGFVGFAQQAKAVEITQYLAFGAAGRPEYELALDKLLCGLSPADPLPEGAGLTPSERDVCDDLLGAALQAWTPLRNSSITTLREGFLQREGRLTQAGEIWELVVVAKPQDLLLDSAPSPYKLVRTRWMPAAIRVRWR